MFTAITHRTFICHKVGFQYVFVFVFVLSFVFFFRAAPEAYGGSQARDLIGATAASLYHCHSNARSKPRLRPIPQLTAILDP